MTNGFTDIHHHLMFGMDDGPKSFEEAQTMLRAAKEDGISRIVVTPHVTPGVQYFDIELYLQRLESLRTGCARQLDIELLPGVEIFYTQTARRMLDEHRILTLANTEHVLVEFLPRFHYEEMLKAVENLLIGGYTPVLAHVERYQCLVSKPQRAFEMKRRLDVRYQVNCSTVVNGKGIFVDRFCKKMFGDGLIDAIATDAHNNNTRPPLMTAAWRAIEKRYGTEYASHLVGADGGLLFQD